MCVCVLIFYFSINYFARIFQMSIINDLLVGWMMVGGVVYVCACVCKNVVQRFYP